MAEQETDELLAQLAAAEAAERNPPPVERTLADGTKITGKDYDELVANVEAHFNAPKEVVQESPKPFPVAPPIAAAPPEAPKPQPTLDVEAWARAIQRDPVEAQNMLDQVRFGADPVAKIRALEAQLQGQAQAFTRKTVRDWQKENKDFDLKAYGNGMDALLKANNLPITEESLDWARDQYYANGWAAKGVPPGPVAVPAKTAPAAPPVAPAIAAPAAAKTGAGTDLFNELMAKINDPDLTPDQRIAMAEKAGLFSPGSESKLNSLGSR